MDCIAINHRKSDNNSFLLFRIRFISFIERLAPYYLQKSKEKEARVFRLKVIAVYGLLATVYVLSLA